MLRYFFALFFIAVIAVLAIAGFRGEISTRRPIEIFPDMDDQPKYRPQHESSFFADGKIQRAPVEGTVPRGYSNPGISYSTSASNSQVLVAPAGFSTQPDYTDTGKIGEEWGTGIPLDLNLEVMERGRERFNINCAICHGETGAGNGIIKQYGLATIVSIIDERVSAYPDGQIFDVITHGKGNMGSYGANIAVPDRWAIVAYLRALQRSGTATAKDVPPDELAKLDQPAETSAPAAPEGGAQ